MTCWVGVCSIVFGTCTLGWVWDNKVDLFAVAEVDVDFDEEPLLENRESAACPAFLDAADRTGTAAEDDCCLFKFVVSIMEAWIALWMSSCSAWFAVCCMAVLVEELVEEVKSSMARSTFPLCRCKAARDAERSKPMRINCCSADDELPLLLPKALFIESASFRNMVE